MKLTARAVAALQPRETPYKVYDSEIKGFYLRVQPNGSTTWRYVYRNTAGRQRDIRIGTGLTPSHARDAAKELHADVAKGVDVVEKRQRERAEGARRRQSTLGTYLNEVYEAAIVRQRTAKLKVDRIRNKFADYLDDQLEDLTPWRLNRWLIKERGRGQSEHTIRRDLADLKALLNHAAKHNTIAHNPIAGWAPEDVESNARVRYLSQEERDRLMEALDARESRMRQKRASADAWRVERGYERKGDLGYFADHLKPMVLVSLNTGLRRRELFELKWRSIDFAGNRITVTSDTAKSKQVRHIPMNSVVQEVFDQWQKQGELGGELVFPGKEGARFDNVDSAWRGLLKVAEVEGFRWHDMRHDFASRLVMKGVDLYRVKTLLGHASVAMTERYAHLAPEHLERAVESLVA